MGLPGHNPGHYAINSDVLLEYIAHAGTEDNDGYSFMADIVAGDFLVYLALGSSQNSDPPSLSLPSGFTELETASANPGGTSAVRYLCGWKKAVGDESSSVQDAGSPEGDVSAVIIQFRPNRNFVSVTKKDSDFEATSGNPTGISTGATPYNLWVGGYICRGTMTGQTVSITPDDERTDFIETGTFDKHFLYRWKSFNPPSSAASVSIDLGDGGAANALVALALSLN